jgi:SPOR domain
MSLINCKECGNEVSDKASTCPKCGIKLSLKLSFISSVIRVLGGIVFGSLALLYVFSYISNSNNENNQPITENVASLDHSVDNNISEVTEKAEEKKVNLSKPVFTEENAVICPFSMLHEKRAGKTFKAANDAVISFFGRKEQLAEVGCEEWREGIQLYLISPQDDEVWIEASTFKDGSDRFYVLKYYLKNKENSLTNNKGSHSEQLIHDLKEKSLIKLTACFNKKISTGEYSAFDNLVSAKKLIVECRELADNLVKAYGVDSDGDYSLTGIAQNAIIKDFGLKHPFPSSAIELKNSKEMTNTPIINANIDETIPIQDIENHQFYVQIGLFSEMGNVTKLQSKLTDLGYESQVEKIKTPNGEKMRLRTNTFEGRAEAAIALENIQDAGLTGIVASE